jgi:hypothetical protein
MSVLLLVWVLLASIAEYALGIVVPESPNLTKRALAYLILWPNALARGLRGLYGRNAYRFTKINQFAQWLKT